METEITPPDGPCGSGRTLFSSTSVHSALEVFTLMCYTNLSFTYLYWKQNESGRYSLQNTNKTLPRCMSCAEDIFPEYL